MSAATGTPPSVAILLATFNGAEFVSAQIRSLKANRTTFTLHWLDDHSTDVTRDVVRAVAREEGVPLQEWHQPQHLGVPAGFFHLLECVSADLYLFCDQDDIWQPGKIDATVANLLPDLDRPVLCYSDPLIFHSGQPHTVRPLSDVMGVKPPKSLQESRLFMAACACGHTQGFTRALRDLYMQHRSIAREYAAMHDSWLYLIAVAAGEGRMLRNAPTTLYRRHEKNFSSALGSLRLHRIWQMHQWLRKAVSKQARGFILAAPTLPPGPRMTRFLETARLVATLDRRQSPLTLLRLARQSALWPNTRWVIPFTAVCLCSDAAA
jgi:glycosyltransferase involved in cell wall biosynthesis